MNIGKMLKQAQKMQQMMTDMQDSFKKKEFEATAGGGAVHMVITGDFQVKSLSIQPDVISPDDKEGLEDLLLSAFNQAVSTVREALEKEMGGIAGDIGLPPGLGL